MIEAKVVLTQPLSNRRQFVARTGGGHSFLIDDVHQSTGSFHYDKVAWICTAIRSGRPEFTKGSLKERQAVRSNWFLK